MTEDVVALKARNDIRGDTLTSDAKNYDMVPKKPCIINFQIAARVFTAASACLTIAQYLLKIISNSSLKDLVDDPEHIGQILANMNFGQFQTYFITLLNWCYCILLLYSVMLNNTSKQKQKFWQNMEFLTSPLKVVIFSVYIIIAQAPQAVFQKIKADGLESYDAFNLAQSVLMVINLSFILIVLIYGIMAMCGKKAAVSYYLAQGVEFQTFKLGL